MQTKIIKLTEKEHKFLAERLFAISLRDYFGTERLTRKERNTLRRLQCKVE